MAQGSKKPGGRAKAKSGGSQKRRAAKSLKTGRKVYKPKGRKAAEARPEVATSRGIEKKNEAIIAARAVSAGDRFFLSEVKEKGTKELTAQMKHRNRKEDREKKLTERLKDQLRKLGRDI